jgi:hypothetical protein
MWLQGHSSNRCDGRQNNKGSGAQGVWLYSSSIRNQEQQSIPWWYGWVWLLLGLLSHDGAHRRTHQQNTTCSLVFTWGPFLRGRPALAACPQGWEACCATALSLVWLHPMCTSGAASHSCSARPAYGVVGVLHGCGGSATWVWWECFMGVWEMLSWDPWCAW